MVGHILHRDERMLHVSTYEKGTYISRRQAGFTFRSILASVLIKPAYLSPINTLQDMLESPSQFVVPGGSFAEILMKIDPRPDVKVLYDKRVAVPYVTGEFSKSLQER